MKLSRLRIEKCLVRPVPWTEDRRDRYLGLTLFVSVATLITIWAAERIAMHWEIFWLHLLLLKIAYEQLCCWFSAHTCPPCAGLGAWAVQCLQIFARTGQGQSATVSDPGPAQAVQGRSHRSRSWRHRGLCWWWWWHWDLIVSRSPGYRPRCPPCVCLYFPALPQIITGSGSVTCCVCPGLARAGECTRTRSVTESEMKWYNTQVAEYFINPLFCRRQNNFIELGLFLKLD